MVGLVVGLRAQIAEELDLRNEARTMDTFRALFEALGLDRLVVPQVHHELTGRRVLVMDYIDGVAVDDFARAEAMGVDPRPLVRDLLKAWVLSALRAGAFHADIHAGNMLVYVTGGWRCSIGGSSRCSTRRRACSCGGCARYRWGTRKCGLIGRDVDGRVGRGAGGARAYGRGDGALYPRRAGAGAHAADGRGEHGEPAGEGR